MADTPLLHGWRPYKPSLISSGRVSSAPDPRFINLRNNTYSSSSESGNIVGLNDMSDMFRLSSCQSTFTEGCINGYNVLTWSWTSDIYYISYKINSGSWVNLPCGASGPLVNSSLTKGDQIQAQGICGVQITHDENEACGFTEYPANTNIYVFYDVTSMEYGDAKEFRQAVEDWAHDFIGDNPNDYIGNIYHIPMMHERWVLWPSYPIQGILPNYYQMSPGSPSDDQHWASVGQTGGGWGIEDCDIGGNNAAHGPEDQNGTDRLIPWKGPLVSSDSLPNYDALANVNNPMGGGTQFSPGFVALKLDDAQPSRDAWNVALESSYTAAGDPFIRLPKDGDTIPNFNGSGPKVIGYPTYTVNPNGSLTGTGAYIPNEGANLKDIRTGDWNGSSNNGNSNEFDAGGSRAQFIGGDTDCLVICLSDETVHFANSGTKANPHMINAPSWPHGSGAEQGYHGHVTHHTNECQLDDPDWVNLSATDAVAQAKRNFFIELQDNCNLYPYAGGYVTSNTHGCDYSGTQYSSPLVGGGAGANSSIGLTGFTQASSLYPLQECMARDCHSYNSNFYFAGYDWDKGTLGVFVSGTTTGSTIPDCKIFRKEGHSNDIPDGKFGWADWSTNGYSSANMHIEPVCGYPTCDNITSPYNANCHFDVLSQPTPGYIYDYKQHLTLTWPIIKALDTAPNSAGGVGSLFSTYFYVVSRNTQAPGLVQNPLTLAAAIEGTIVGVGDFTIKPLVPNTGTIDVNALDYFNPYGEIDYWHPTSTVFGWDPNLAPDWVPGNFGLKHYMKGPNGKCGYNIERDSWTKALVQSDLNDFIAPGGVFCDGNDCILITTVDSNGAIVGGVSFDFDNNMITTDANGEWQTTVPAGIYAFLCNSVSINTSPHIVGDHASPWMATDPPTPGHTGTFGCNFWRITLTVVGDSYTLIENCKRGCTDGTGINNPISSSAACNYDPTAGVDDGSCIYADCSDMCPDPVGSTPYTPYIGLDTYPNDTTVFPFYWQWGGGDAYFDVTCPHCCVGGNTGLLPADCVDCLGVCDGTAVYDECGVCNGPGPDECGICFGDGTCCVGCTDPLASNFNPDATIQCDPDCCEYSDIECKLRELSRRLLETCEKDCCQDSKEMLLEATMLYTSLFMVSEECNGDNGTGMNKNKIHSILKALERLLGKIECGVCCKNC